MDDFPDNEKAALLEDFARGIGEIDGALDAVAEAKLLCQPHGHAVDRDDAPIAPDFVDNVAAIVRFDLFLDGGHDFRSAEVDLVTGSGAAGDEVCAHRLMSPKETPSQLVRRA